MAVGKNENKKGAAIIKTKITCQFIFVNRSWDFRNKSIGLFNNDIEVYNFTKKFSLQIGKLKIKWAFKIELDFSIKKKKSNKGHISTFIYKLKSFDWNH